MKHTAKPVVFQDVLKPTQQYVTVASIGNKVYTRARTPNGDPVYVEQEYAPTYFVPVADEASATHRGFEGKPLVAKPFESMYDARNYIKSAKVPVYGDIQCEYMMLGDVYGVVDVPHDIDRLYVWNIDIEVDSDNGFARPDDPFAEVTAIAVQWRHLGLTGTVVYGRGDFVAKDQFKDVLYLKFDSEEDLLNGFLSDFKASGDYPDIVTGWNIQFYDIPYLVNRMKRLDLDHMQFSPFGRMQERSVLRKFREENVLEIKGLVILDYLELYEKFRLVQRESYRLDFIAHVELGKRKLSYEEVGSLRKLYQLDHQKFIEYNITDVWLVDELDQKVKYLELVCALGYTAKSNLVDTMKQVRLWDIMIYHKLRQDGFQIPPRKVSVKTEKFAGAYVKEPTPGAYDWVVSFDVASMYPHIIRQWNLSPETKKFKASGFGVSDIPDLMDQALDLSDLPNTDTCMASNGVVCERAREGFIPAMLKTLYVERKKFKNLQAQANKDLKNETDPVKKKELAKLVASYGNAQQVRKVNLNSAYGAMGSEYFRFFDIDLAEAVTVTGQMVIQWVARDLNTYLNKILKTTNADYVIASDTDSVYLCLGELVKRGPQVPTEKMVDILDKMCDTKFQAVIDQTFTDIATYMNVAVPCLSMVRDVIADKGIWTGKKHYILNTWDSEKQRYNPPKLKMMGIQTIQSSTPAAVREMLTVALHKLMNGSQDDVWAYVKECEATFRASSFEDIAKPMSVNKLADYSLEKSDTMPIQVRGALTFNDMLDRSGLTGHYEPVMSGEKIRYAYLKKPNPFFSHVMSAPHGCPKEWEIEKWLDYDIQFEKVFLSPLEDILNAAGWSTHKEASLFD